MVIEPHICKVVHLSPMAGLVILNEDQVRRLAELVYLREVNAIHMIRFNSEYERAQYLGDCREGRDTVLSLLGAGAHLKHKYNGCPTRSPIAHDIFTYIVKAFNIAIQSVRNYHLRLTYLAKIKVHARTIMDTLRTLDPRNVEKAENLAREAVEYKNFMADYTARMQNTVSRNFSRMLQPSHINFKDLVMRGMEKLGFQTRNFNELEGVQKIDVYCEIGEMSGRGGRITQALKTALGIGGMAVILFTVSLMAWDIFSAERPIERVARNTAMAAAPVAGAAIAGVVTAVVETAFDGDAAVLFLVGVISSFAGAFIVGAAVGLLIDLIFNSGGTANLNHFQNHHCGVVALPDGQVIARQIANGGIN